MGKVHVVKTSPTPMILGIWGKIDITFLKLFNIFKSLFQYSFKNLFCIVLYRHCFRKRICLLSKRKTKKISRCRTCLSLISRTGFFVSSIRARICDKLCLACVNLKEIGFCNEENVILVVAYFHKEKHSNSKYYSICSIFFGGRGQFSTS